MRILQDLETGEPVTDFKGNLVLTDTARAFRQYLEVLFHTPIFEEVSLPTWGLPIKEIFHLKSDSNWENMVKYFFVQALNPRFEPLIHEIRSIDIERNGSTLNVSIHVVSKYGTESVNEVVLNE